MYARSIQRGSYLLLALLCLSFSLSSALSSPWDLSQRQHPTLDRRHVDYKNDSTGNIRMRILALFSSTSNDLGVDHRIGRQVLKLALERAKRVRPEVSEIDLIVHNELADCRELSLLPSFVAEQFYLDNQNKPNQCDAEGEQEGRAGSSETSKVEYIGQTVTLESNLKNRDPDQTCRSMQVLQNNELNEYFSDEEPRSNLVNSSQSDDRSRAVASGRSRIDAIIGPSCDSLVDIVARMAAYWRTPIYTVTSINAQFGRKDVFSTLTRLSPSIEHLSVFIIKIMKQFKWRHLAILVDRNRLENNILLENLERTIDHNQHNIAIERNVLEFKNIEQPTNHQSYLKNKTVYHDVDQQNTTKMSLCSEEMRTKLVEASRVSRVLLLLLDDITSVRNLLLCAHELDMNNGEYIFITLNLALKPTIATELKATGRESSTSIRSKTAQDSLDWFVPEDEANNIKARQMFESLMVLSVEQPVGDEYNAFVEQTLDLANQAYPSVRFERSNLGPVAVALHDSLLLAVEAHWLRLSSKHEQSDLVSRYSKTYRGIGPDRVDLEDKLDRGEADHYNEAALMWNKTYSYGLMTSLHINSNGDQELDYILSDLEPEMGSMRPVARYSEQTRQVQMLPNSYIHWPARVSTNRAGSQELIDSDEAPPDEPECGFDGNAERCIDRQNLYAVLTFLSILIILIIGVSVISLQRYKRIKYQMKLDDFWWRIQWEDLMFLEIGGARAASGVDSILSGRESVQRSSAGARSHIDPRRAPVAPSILGFDHSISKKTNVEQQQEATGGSKIGTASAAGSHFIKSEFSVVIRQSRFAKYKNDYVIVKQLNSDAIEINRNLLVELKSMRELCQENLARFVGLCIEPGRVAIVGEYCSRGSLKDLLQNDDVAMDLTLKYSILGDIINGLNFIHTSLLNFHGRLKSTNLVLDSRFTVKLTDFGLRSLYNQLDAVEDQDSDSSNDDNYINDNDSQLRDAKSISNRRPSMTQTIYQMDSVSMRGEMATNRATGSMIGSGYARQIQLKNRGPVRYFWTAPEHLREKCPHFAGSKRGDIYSLSIIMFELFTRKEPYYYGTNASPNLAALKRIKKTHLERPSTSSHRVSLISADRLRTNRLSIASAASSQMSSRRKSRLSTSGGLSEMIGRQADRVLDRVRRSQASVGPVEKQELESSARLASPSVVIQYAPSDKTVVPVEQPSISVSTVAAKPIGEEPASEEHAGGDSEAENRKQGAGSGNSSAVNTRVNAAGTRHSSVFRASSGKIVDRATRAGSSAPKSKGSDVEICITTAMANKILDQLRMGVQPEPVRPYVPNSVLQEVDVNLIELMRSCWQESPNMRPSVERVRNKIKKITAGAASKNYLDNLLERLQTYASELERIVDEKSADIISEKARTEELLYQLVPKFIADKLKHHEPIIPQLFDGVTVFFSDIVGFEKYAAVMSPIELVDLLNNIYSSFESIINSFDVIKIEVILDQFLVASGVSLQDSSGVSNGVAEQMPPKEAQKQVVPSSELGQQTKQNDGAGNGGTKGAKSTKKLLNAIRLTQQTEGSENKQVDRSNGNHEEKKSNEINMVARSENYKRNCAEQIARMALCIRDLVKSFHFRQTLSRASGSQTMARADCNVASEGELIDANAGKKTPVDSADESMQSKPKIENIVAATFNIRIGIHSGKVCAGIVGLKRPKFCLIGDTVNVASRMHTNSKANKIQVSADTSNLLRGVPGLYTQARGKIEVKGKGQMETYWLETSH